MTTKTTASGRIGVTSVSVTGDNRIDGVLEGHRWNSSVLTFAFPDQKSDYSYAGEKNHGFGDVETHIKAAVRYTLEQSFGGAANDGFSVEGFTKLKIAEGSDAGSVLRYANSTSANPTAYAYYPSAQERGGDVWFGNQYPYENAKMGNYYFATVIHETGHALGLKHGHETSGDFDALKSRYDSLEYTVMSYRSYQGASTTGGYTNAAWDFPQSYMMADIAALQHMYGADYSTNSGKTVYSWNPDSGVTYVNDAAALTPGGKKIFATIWDGGGVDTYDLSAYENNLSLDLRPGEESRFSRWQSANLDSSDPSNLASGNIYNALLHDGNTASLIENAIGGSGNDTIRGNQGENRLSGSAGDDKLLGGDAHDVLIGGKGADTFVFADGWGRDRVADFSDDDRIDLSDFNLSSLAAVKALLDQSGGDVQIKLGDGDVLVIADVKIGDLERNDFIL